MSQPLAIHTGRWGFRSQHLSNLYPGVTFAPAVFLSRGLRTNQDGVRVEVQNQRVDGGDVGGVRTNQNAAPF